MKKIGLSDVKIVKAVSIAMEILFQIKESINPVM